MDVLIPIVFPDYKIKAFGKEWEDLGHAGILFILGTKGVCKYYEYGRYDTDKGQVRKRTIPDAKIDKKTQKIDLPSLAQVLKSISKQSGHDTRISGAYIEQAHGFQKALDYVEGQKKLNADPNRKEYGLLRHNCGTFMQDTLEAAGVNTPWMIAPWPNSYIKELRGDFPHLDYDPGTGKLIIGK